MIRRFVLAFLAAFVVEAAMAETVDVRDKGQVDLTAFACRDVVGTRYVRRVCFNASDRYLLTNIGGAYYQSCDVGQDVVDAMLGARSIDGFYERNMLSRRRRPSRFACRGNEPPVMRADAPHTSSPAAVGGTKVKAWGYGAETCAAWTKDHQNRDAEGVSAEDSWVNGFVTAFEVYGRAADAAQKLATMTDWIDGHCRTNPADTLSDAAQAFTRDIEQSGR